MARVCSGIGTCYVLSCAGQVLRAGFRTQKEHHLELESGRTVERCKFLHQIPIAFTSFPVSGISGHFYNFLTPLRGYELGTMSCIAPQETTAVDSNELHPMGADGAPISKRSCSHGLLSFVLRWAYYTFTKYCFACFLFFPPSLSTASSSTLPVTTAPNAASCIETT